VAYTTLALLMVSLIQLTRSVMNVRNCVILGLCAASAASLLPFLLSVAGPKTFFVSRRTSCYGRRTTCSVREDKVCPPSLSKSSDKACNHTGTHFHFYNLQKHLYVV